MRMAEIGKLRRSRVIVSSICLGMNRIEPAVSPFQGRAHPLQGCIRAHRAPVPNFLGAFCAWWLRTLLNVERGHEISQRHQRVLPSNKPIPSNIPLPSNKPGHLAPRKRIPR